jgi:hypothetical protein
VIDRLAGRLLAGWLCSSSRLSLPTSLCPLQRRNPNSVLWQLANPQAGVANLCGELAANGAETHPFSSFPYVCPEPVLVKRSFLYINGDINGEEERMAQKVVIAPLSHHANHASRRARDKHEEILTHWMVVLFLNFTYVCPEPVLVNVRCFIKRAQKGGFRGRDRL